MTVCEPSLLASLLDLCFFPGYPFRDLHHQSSLHLSVIWGLWLVINHLPLSLLILPSLLADSSLLEVGTDDYQVKTGAQEWQLWRVTGDQGQTWHFGFTNVIYYFSEAGWWHTRLTSWHGLYLPGSEGTHCYQLLLITLKIPQPHPVANSRDLSGRSASFRTVLQSGTTEVNDFPTRTVRWSALRTLAFSWPRSNQVSSLSTFPIFFVASVWILKDGPSLYKEVPGHVPALRPSFSS